MRLFGLLASARLRQWPDTKDAAKRAMRSLKQGGIRQLATDVKSAARRASLSGRDYASWIAQYDTLTGADISTMRDRVLAFAIQPKISIIMPVYNTPKGLLSEAIESVMAQTYHNWELCIADDASSDAGVRDILHSYEAKDARIKVVYRENNGHIVNASNSALDIAQGEWIALLDHDDRLAPHALFCVVDAIHEKPNVKLIYSDEDKIGVDGKRHDPYFKCDWNYDLFLSHNLVCHLGVYRADIVRDLGGFREGFEGAQDYDLALRFVGRIDRQEIVHIPHVLYHWRTLPGSTALSTDEKPYAMEAGKRALEDFLKQKNVAAEVELLPQGFRANYVIENDPPKVSIIIPTRNAHGLVKTCLESIYSKTSYLEYEVILIDNGSDDLQSLELFRKFADEHGVKILRDDRAFNYSALNNKAVEAASGEIIVLMNNDIEIITPNWLDEMVSLVLRDGVGAVGAKLYYPNDTIQHAGVILGLGGVAGHGFCHLPRSTFGYMSRAALRQEMSAVTAACLAVRKDYYLAVGGLNEKNLAVAFNDVDFCLKLQEARLINVWTPFAELYHHESASRGYEDNPEKQARFKGEIEYMKERWSDALGNDPAYSPNLTLAGRSYEFACPPRTKKPWRKECAVGS